MNVYICWLGGRGKNKMGGGVRFSEAGINLEEEKL